LCAVSVLGDFTLREEAVLSHDEQVALMFEEEQRNIEDQNLHVRFYALPEINVKTNDSYNELRLMKEEVGLSEELDTGHSACRCSVIS